MLPNTFVDLPKSRRVWATGGVCAKCYGGSTAAILGISGHLALSQRCASEQPWIWVNRPLKRIVQHNRTDSIVGQGTMKKQWRNNEATMNLCGCWNLYPQPVFLAQWLTTLHFSGLLRKPFSFARAHAKKERMHRPQADCFFQKVAILHPYLDLSLGDLLKSGTKSPLKIWAQHMPCFSLSSGWRVPMPMVECCRKLGAQWNLAEPRHRWALVIELFVIHNDPLKFQFT